MRKIINPAGLMIVLVTLAIGCKKSSSNEVSASELTQEEKALMASADFNSN